MLPNNILHLMTTENLLRELDFLFKKIDISEIDANQIKAILCTAKSNYQTILSAIKLYKKFIYKRDNYIKNYDITRLGVVVFNKKTQTKKTITNRINIDKSWNNLINSDNKMEIHNTKMREIDFVKLLLHNDYLVIVVCFIIATKMHHDNAYTNLCWQKVSNLDHFEILIVEKMLFEIFNYNLFFPGEEQLYKEINLALRNKNSQSSNNIKRLKERFKSFFCFM